MTDVRFSAKDSVGLSPGSIAFRIAATRELLESGVGIRLPIEREYDVTLSDVTISLPSTALFGGGWAYRVTWLHRGNPVLTEFVSVQDSGSTINYEALTRVDPKTLT